MTAWLWCGASGILPRFAHRIGGFAVPRNKRVGAVRPKADHVDFFYPVKAMLAFESGVSYDFFNSSSKG